MADDALAARIRRQLADRKQVSEKRMFGGVCFLLNGNMLCGTAKERLMFRPGHLPDCRTAANDRYWPKADLLKRPLPKARYPALRGNDKGRNQGLMGHDIRKERWPCAGGHNFERAQEPSDQEVYAGSCKSRGLGNPKRALTRDCSLAEFVEIETYHTCIWPA